MATIESIKRMQAIRRLARIQPIHLLEDRLAQIADLAHEKSAAKPAAAKPEPKPEAAPAEPRAERKGHDRMEKGGKDR